MRTFTRILDETYTHDTLAQLTAVSRGGGAYQSFGVDSLGNIGSVTTGGTEQDRTSNSENQLTAVGSTALAYDANGNLTTDDQGRTLVYDAWNRLLAVMDGGVIVVSYGYDGLGRLITETDASGTRTDTYFSGTQDIETRVDGAVASENVFSPVYVNAILLRDAGGERVYFTADANYNVTGVVGTSGTMLQRQVYDAYGNVTFTDASWSPLTADGQGLTHLYQGMLYAPEIGWYYSGQSNFARWYSPGLMIWTRGDQGYIDSMDLYEPFAANPIKYTDATGLTKATIWITVDSANRPSSFNLNEVAQRFYTIMGANAQGQKSLIRDSVQFLLTNHSRGRTTVGGRDVTPPLGWTTLCDDYFYYGELKWNPTPVSLGASSNSYNEDGKTAWVNLPEVDRTKPSNNLLDYWANTVAHENFYHGAYASLVDGLTYTTKDQNDSSHVGTIEYGLPTWSGLVKLSSWVWGDFMRHRGLK